MAGHVPSQAGHRTFVHSLPAHAPTGSPVVTSPDLYSKGPGFKTGDRLAWQVFLAFPSPAG